MEQGRVFLEIFEAQILSREERNHRQNEETKKEWRKQQKEEKYSSHSIWQLLSWNQG